MGEGCVGVIRGIVAVLLLVVAGSGCPFSTEQSTDLAVESQEAASPPEVPQQPVSDAAPVTAEPQPAPPRSSANTVTITTPDGAVIEYSKDPKNLIIMMRGEHGGERAVWDPTPALRIYGDGRVLLKSYWEYYLTQEEIVDLLKFLHIKGVLDFDEQMVNAELDRVDAASGKPFANRYLQRIQREGSPDSAPTIIEIGLDAYKPVGKDSNVIRPFTKRIRRKDILLDAALYPNVQAVTGLAETVRQFVDVVMKDAASKGHKITRQDARDGA